MSPSGREDAATAAGEQDARAPFVAEARDRAADEAIVIVDASGVVRAWSHGAERILGHTGAEIVGRPAAELVPESLRDGYAATRDALVGAGDDSWFGGRWSMPLLRADGTTWMGDIEFTRLVLDGETLVVVHLRELRDEEGPGLTNVLLERIFEHAPEAITLIDANRRQRTVNARGLEMLGYGKGFRHPIDGRLLVHPDDLARVVAHRITSGVGLKAPVRYRVQAADGSWRWLESIGTDLLDDPDVQASIVFSRDVTADEERAQALRITAARLHALISNIRPASFLEDEHGVVVLRNHALSELMPVTPSDRLHSDDVLAAVAAATVDSDATRAMLARARDGHHGDNDLVLRDGRTIEVESFPIDTDDQMLGRMWLFRDITVQHEAARQREQLLALEQAARVQAEEQAEQLLVLDQVRTDFVATVSHELRTPLTSITSATDYLLTATPEELAEDLESFLQVIQRNTRRLQRLVEDLLVVGRLDAGLLDLVIEPVDLPALVAEVIDELAPAAAKKGMALRLEHTDGPPFHGDAMRLQQITENLVTNALKFAPEGTAVDVRCLFSDGAWVLSVLDRGPGIDPDELPMVFDRFYRSRWAQKLSVQGTGLGLTIVRGLVELQGGEVSARSVPGEETEFRCVFHLDGVHRRTQ